MDELGLKEFVDLCGYKSITLRVEDALLLAIRLEMGFDAEAVSYEGGVDAWHV